ncbi:MAG: flippase-like domain-containing protein [Dehalococcoidia bacterium]|nr:flippase-like domain-containing protein [Dehalococcoidia bacterium]
MLRSPRIWLGIALSALFIAIFLWRTDFSEIGRAFAHANYWWALASIPVYFVAAYFRAWRWKYLLRPLGEMRVSALFPIVIIGFMANNLIPARAGEFVRAYIVGEREKVSKMAALGTIAVDRVFDGITLLPFLLIVAAVSGANFDLRVFHFSVDLRAIAALMAILFGVGLVLLVVLALSEGLSRRLVAFVLRFVPARLKPQVQTLAESFLTGLHSFRSPTDMFLASATSVVSWLLEATMYYMIGLVFGLDLGFEVYLLICAGANLAIAVIPTQGGVGPFEFVTQQTAMYFGVARDPAFAYAVALHALLLIPVIAVGLYFLWSINLSLGEVLRGRAKAGATEAMVEE